MRKVLAFVLVACTASVVKTDIIQLNNAPNAPKNWITGTIEYIPEEFKKVFNVNPKRVGIRAQEVKEWLYLLNSTDQKPALMLNTIDIRSENEQHTYHLNSFGFDPTYTKPNIFMEFKDPNSVLQIRLDISNNAQSSGPEMTPEQQKTVKDFVATIQTETAQKEIDLTALITVLDRMSSINSVNLYQSDAYGKRYMVTSSTGFEIQFTNST